VGRLARVIALGVAHHVTQRGNGRRFLLDGDADRRIYLDLLQQNLRLNDVLLVGYCLMSSHVLLIVIPGNEEGLALSLKHTHGRYASYWNVVHNLSGHGWEGRYYSCPLDRPHLWAALRYTELNPVGAKLVTDATSWPWSSAAAHCGSAQADKFLSMELWRTGRTRAGASIWQRQRRKQSWPRSDSAHIHAVPWVRRNSSTRWRKQWSGDWFLKKADVQQNLDQMQDRRIFILIRDEVLNANVGIRRNVL
jgi:REP element-mobilizing transposase RayT